MFCFFFLNYKLTNSSYEEKTHLLDDENNWLHYVEHNNWFLIPQIQCYVGESFLVNQFSSIWTRDDHHHFDLRMDVSQTLVWLSNPVVDQQMI